MLLCTGFRCAAQCEDFCLKVYTGYNKVPRETSLKMSLKISCLVGVPSPAFSGFREKYPHRAPCFDFSCFTASYFYDLMQT